MVTRAAVVQSATVCRELGVAELEALEKLLLQLEALGSNVVVLVDLEVNFTLLEEFGQSLAAIAVEDGFWQSGDGRPKALLPVLLLDTAEEADHAELLLGVVRRKRLRD